MATPLPRAFAQVDVFSRTPYLGNPVAVVLDAEGIDDDAMAAFARWTNLSETTFVLPPESPEADYRLRIFTPGGELPFAGHPTLGSAHAWLEHVGAPKDPNRIVQECIAGLIAITRDDDALLFRAPPTTRSGPVDEGQLVGVAHALNVERSAIVDHQWVDNGPGWLAVQLASADEVLAIEPDFSAIPSAMVGVFGAYPDGSEHAYEMRAFAIGVGAGEDPVTGSLNASVAQWLVRTGQVPQSYTVSQGTRLGRAGVVSVSLDDEGAVWIGGASTTLIRGTVLL